MSEAQETKEKHLEETNRSIALRISNLLKVHDKTPGLGKYFHISNIMFINPNAENQDKRVFLTAYEKAVEAEEVAPQEVLDGLVSPIYAFGLSSDAKPVRVTSQLGVVSNLVIGSDNNLYHAINTIVFDSDGKALKVEEFVSAKMEETATLEEQLDRMIGRSKAEQIRDQIDKLETVPSTEPRIVPLAPGDYENISHYLDKIDSGELKPSH